MTRKEAIDCIRAHMEYPQSICTRCKYRYATQPCEMRTAFRMAKDALEGDSLIDRALKNIDKELSEFADFVCTSISNKKDEETARVLIALAMTRAKDAVLALKEGE